MIRVAYDHQIFGWQKYGGISRYFYELARRVGDSEGFSASIVAPLYINGYLKEGGTNVTGMHIPVIPKTRRIVSLANRLIGPALLKLGNPDLVHETYYQRASLLKMNCPTVITVYDMIHEKFKATFDSRDETTIAKRAAVNRADRVICISENTRADLIELFNPDPGKIKTIHLGFSLTTHADPVMAPSLPKPFFLYVGQRGGYKNFLTLVSAYAAALRVRADFDLVSFGGGPFSPEETQSIIAAGLDLDRVRHVGGDDALLCHLYRRATALIYPSLYEGFGIPPLEAMSLGCPVLCSDSSSIREVVGDAGLYFDPNAVDAIGNAMERAAHSEELRSQLIARGASRVKEFSYDRCASETIAVYRDALR
jgi:glycosyltransferase involved in cell wall biosynthesis